MCNKKGVFVNYQMAEAIELLSKYDLSIPEQKEKAEITLLELKKSGLILIK